MGVESRSPSDLNFVSCLSFALHYIAIIHPSFTLHSRTFFYHHRIIYLSKRPVSLWPIDAFSTLQRKARLPFPVICAILTAKQPLKDSKLLYIINDSSVNPFSAFSEETKF